MNKLVFYAKSTTELLTILKNNINAQIVGGCTRLEELPERAISTKKIKEFNQISRHERYINVGSAVTLNALLELGQSHLPPIIYEALNCIANPIIRNMATIGGNICSPGQKLTLYAPLMALDAKLEFRNQNEVKNESIRTFKTIPEGFVLSAIKIPLVDSDISVFRRIGPEHSISELSGSFAFIVNTEKNIILNTKLAFAGPVTFLSKDLENALIGKRLPLSGKEILQLQEIVIEEFNKSTTDKMISNVVKQQFFNLTKYSFEQLS